MHFLSAKYIESIRRCRFAEHDLEIKPIRQDEVRETDIRRIGFFWHICFFDKVEKRFPNDITADIKDKADCFLARNNIC